MNSRQSVIKMGCWLICATAVLLFPVVCRAAIITKADNAVALNLTNSWVVEVVPTNTDVAMWDSTVTGENVVNLGANRSWLGLTILNPGGDVTISNSPAATLTLGTNGVDISVATANLTMLCNVTLGVSQTWTVAGDVTNTVAGVISGSSGITLTKAGVGRLVFRTNSTYTGKTVVSEGTLALVSVAAVSSTIIEINSDSTLDVSGRTNSSFTISTGRILTNSTGSGVATINATGGTLAFASGAFAGFTAVGGGSPTVGKISVAGNLTFSNNTVTINVTGVALPSGTYRLMDCTGTLNGKLNPVPTIGGLGLAAGTAAYLDTIGGNAGHIDLVVIGSETVGFKANNTVALDLTNSWVGGGVPGNADVATWNSIVSGANTSNLGTNQNWRGIKILNPLGVVTIGNSPAAILTLGTNGVDMTQATTNLIINCGITLGVSQTWNITAGRTNTVSGAIDGPSSSTLINEGAGTLRLHNYNTFAGDVIINGGLVSADWGTVGSGGGALSNNVNSALGVVVTNRTVTVNSGAILSIDRGNVFAGGYTTNVTPAPLIVVNQGAVLRTRARFSDNPPLRWDGNNFGRIMLNGGMFDLGSSCCSAYGAAILTDTVTVEGTAASTIIATGDTYSFANLGFYFSTNGVVFNVADATGDSNADLIVSASLHDAAGIYTVPTNYYTSLTKAGSGTMLLSATNTYAGATIISAGTLSLNGRGRINNSSNIVVSSGATLDVSGVTNSPYLLVSGQTLKGNGTVRGALTFTNGATLSPGTSIGTLTFTTNLTLNGNTLIEVNKDGDTNDLFTVSGNLTYGGTLIVTTLAGELQIGDSFVIASAVTRAGNFTNIVGSPGEGRAWSFNPATGTLSVILGPSTLYASQSDNTFTFSWVGDFKLQAQTNDLSIGISTNPADWFDYPGGTNSPVNHTNDFVNGCVFFRLINN